MSGSLGQSLQYRCGPCLLPQCRSSANSLRHSRPLVHTVVMVAGCMDFCCWALEPTIAYRALWHSRKHGTADKPTHMQLETRPSYNHACTPEGFAMPGAMWTAYAAC